MTQADLFEQVIQSRYLGTKRFSLEGVTVLIPFLDEILNHAADLGAVKSVIGMSHRGRLNVMANTFGKSPADIFSKFEDANPRSILGCLLYTSPTLPRGPINDGMDQPTGDAAERPPSEMLIHISASVAVRA